MPQWKPFEFHGVLYDLAHLHPKPVVYRQAAAAGKPEREYRVDVEFSMHCFTHGIKDGENPDAGLLYRDSRECRVFDFRRYALSKHLPAIVEGLHQRKCQHSGKGNFFVVGILTEEGEKVEYDIFFAASRSARKGVVNLYVQSAYVRDAEHAGNRPKNGKHKPIGFTVILLNTLNNKPNKDPK
jgi:hypothetical protein